MSVWAQKKRTAFRVSFLSSGLRPTKELTFTLK